MMPFKVLVVDDEEEICRLFVKVLSLEGYEVKYALTGKSALHIIKKEQFNVIFLDMFIPGMPGVDVLEKLKKISPKTKVVIITGELINKKFLKKLGQKGAIAFLQKPFKIEEISEVLSKIAHSKIEN